jgi:hypothetical protein
MNIRKAKNIYQISLLKPIVLPKIDAINPKVVKVTVMPKAKNNE